MATALEMLSDGDQDNNNDAFSMLHEILLHTGDAANALAALLLVQRDIPMRHLKGVLTELLLKGPEGTLTDVEEEVATEILGLLKTDENMNDDNDRGVETFHAVEQLLSKVKELHGHAAGSEGRQQQQQQQQGNDEDSKQESLQKKPEKPSDNAPVVKDEKDPRLRAYAAATEMLERLVMMLNNTWYYECDNCRANWDFSNSMYACRFCHDAGLCQTCFEALQTETAGARGGGGHRANRNRLLCGPHHEWLVLPRWDARQWAESFNKKVRVYGSVAQPGGGEAAEGVYSTVSASSWLRSIAKEWGFEQEDWDL
jgi:hypothetical protein